MAFIIEEHNTFLGLLSTAPSSQRRSASLPPCLKPAGGEQKLWSDVASYSTEAPDDASVDGSELSTPSEPAAPQRPTPLKRSAQVYAPSSVAPFAYVLQYVQLFLQSCAGVEDVTVSQEGGAATLGCRVGRGGRFRKQILEGAQQSLMASCESSQTVYVLGYGHEPFKSLGAQGFTATLVTVPLERQDGVCWASCQFGNCRKRATCPWNHPEEFELLEVTFNVDVVSDPNFASVPAASPKVSSSQAKKADFFARLPTSSQPKAISTATKATPGCGAQARANTGSACRCGYKIVSGQRFCVMCGEKIDHAAPDARTSSSGNAEFWPALTAAASSTTSKLIQRC